MEQNHLKKQITLTKNSLFEQGYLDEQFTQLEELQDDANPNFVEEIVTLYYSNSTRLIRNLETALIGAKKVKAECSQFQEFCKARNADGCIRVFQQVKQEHATLKRKLEAYFQIWRQGA
ncbi:pseudo histidine-containing phosphotransfer protein 5-like isoform X2 [Rutidosis leptorrhynchoides]|uniref:pseudo histidine-containing phosphotransfer protein 5-like isoform X2 n=1 Tax=Rutidosis leptorrhynchoides TaxID=125765 RepID=UPI003A99B7D0